MGINACLHFSGSVAIMNPAMNQKLLSLGLLAALVACGCESTRYEPPEALSQNRPSIPPPPPALTLDETQILERAATQPPTPVEGNGWEPLFDGRSLAGWNAIDYGGSGRAQARPGLIFLNKGEPFNGIHRTNVSATVDYELSLEAMRVSGSDFFCGLTFPVNDSHCSLIVGGWGGGVVGLSSLDGADASENETTQYIPFENGKWYRIRLRVTAEKIEAWVEQKKVVNVTTTGRKVSLRFGDIELSKPLGITCWDTASAVREIKIRHIVTPDSPAEQF
jgi:hypothetical protein